MNILGSWGEGKLPAVQKSPISLHESGMNKQSAIVESVIVFARRRYFIVIAHGAHFDNFPTTKHTRIRFRPRRAIRS